jgi:hypothetical protein
MQIGAKRETVIRKEKMGQRFTPPTLIYACRPWQVFVYLVYYSLLM